MVVKNISPQKDTFAIVLTDVFSENELQYLESLQNNFCAATIDTGDVDLQIRYHDRCIIDDFDAAALIEKKVSSHVPQTLSDAEGKTWRYSRVNERLRFLRYEPGMYFRQHYDGAVDLNLEKTFVTIQIYLSSNPDSGATSFIFDEENPNETVKVYPVRGSVLIFEHDILHEGDEVSDGIKETLRTDVFYK